MTTTPVPPRPTAPVALGNKTAAGTIGPNDHGGIAGFPQSGSAPATPSGPLAGLTGDQRNALTALQSLLSAYGLESLSSNILSYVQQGYDAQTTQFLLTQTDAWKQRFAGNEILKQKGLGELDPATYLDLEKQYSSVLNAAGVPSGMFGRSDFATWIGGSVSASEVQSRAQIAANWVNDNDPYFLQALQQFHGITPGHMIGYALDQARGLPALNLISQQSQIGAEALRHGLGANADFSSQLANMGISQGQAAAGYQQIAQELPRLGQLGNIAGKPYTQHTAEQATFLGDQAAAQQRLNIVQQEQAKFVGTPGLGSNLYHPGYGLGRDMEGSY